MSRLSISKRALVAMLAALAVALAAGVVATAKQSGDHSRGFANQLASARLARREGEGAAFKRMLGDLQQVMATDDAVEGLKSFLERREPRF